MVHITNYTAETVSAHLSDIRDSMVDLRRLIDQWECWGFDASEAHKRMEELSSDERTLVDWLMNNQ